MTGNKITKTFYSGKKNREKLFTLLLKCIENDMYQSQIANYMSKKTGKKYTKQRLKYWFDNLKKDKLIQISSYSTTKNHILTATGKKFLTHHEKPLYKGHAYEISYTLKSIGELPENNVKLKNWGYWKERFYDVHIRVNRGKINKLVVYVPEVQASNKSDLLIKIGEKTGMIVNLIERQYKCSVDWNTRNIERRLEVHAPHDPEGKEFTSLGVNYRGEMINVDQSGEASFDLIEKKEYDPFTSIDRYDQMIKTFPEIIKTMGKMVTDQKTILNLYAINTETLKHMKNGILELIKRPLSTQTIKKEKTPQNEDLSHIEIISYVDPFVAEYKGMLKDYPELYPGSRIYINKDVAQLLIDRGKAMLI